MTPMYFLHLTDNVSLVMMPVMLIDHNVRLLEWSRFFKIKLHFNAPLFSYLNYTS